MRFTHQAATFAGMAVILGLTLAVSPLPAFGGGGRGRRRARSS